MATDITKALTVSIIDSSTVSGTLKKFNTTPFPFPIYQIVIVNDSTEPMQISFDGVNIHAYVRASSDRYIYPQAGSQPNNQKNSFPAQSTFWIGGTAGTGNVVLEAYYNQP